MAASPRRRQKSKNLNKKAKKEKPLIPSVPPGRFSLLGWIVPLGPLVIIVFLLLFGRSIPYLVEQSSVEAEDAAKIVCQGAEEDLKAGNYQAAYSKLIYALNIKPDYVDAYVKLGRLYYLNGDITSAIVWLKKAVALDPPQKNLVLNNLGLLYAQKGEFQTALTMFEQALSTGINTEQIYNNIGNVNLSLENYDRAVAAFRAAIEQRPTVRSLYIEMLRKVLIDFQGEDECAYIYEAVREYLERGVTDEELAVYDSVSVSRFVRSEQRQMELNRNLSRALEMKKRTSGPLVP